MVLDKSERRRIVWPDSKTGDMSKPISEEAARLLNSAPRSKGSPYVCPSIFDPMRPMSPHTYSLGWARILQRAEVPHIGTHGIRHRAATDIANSGIPINVGMKLTAHKTVAMFMRYVHTEDKFVRAAAETIALRRKKAIEGNVDAESAFLASSAVVAGASVSGQESADVDQPQIEPKHYRPFHHRNGENREVPAGTKHRPVVSSGEVSHDH